MGSRVKRRQARAVDWTMRDGPRCMQVAAGTSHARPGWAQWPFEMRIRQSPTQERHPRGGFLRRQRQVQCGERQRREVSSFMMRMRYCGAIRIDLKGQRLVVMMSLARLVHQAVLDLKRQGAELSRHEGNRRLQVQHEQDQRKPTTEHGAILAKTLAASDCLGVSDLQVGEPIPRRAEPRLVLCSWPTACDRPAVKPTLPHTDEC